MSRTSPNKSAIESDWASELREHLRRTIELRPGARSALRRGLRRTPLECTQMHPYIPTRFVPEWGLDRARERAVYTVAALAGAWPDLLDDDSGATVGEALGALEEDRRDWAERRLTQLCRSDATQLNDRLTSIIGALDRWGLTVDLAQLAKDLDRWERDQTKIVRSWVRAFDAALERKEPDTGVIDQPSSLNNVS